MKVSQLDKAIASFIAERDEAWEAAVLKNAIFNSAIEKLEEQKRKAPKKPPVPRKVRKLGSVLDEPTP